MLRLPEVFSEICIASRHRENCEALAEKLRPNTKTIITTAKVDASITSDVVRLIKDYKPELVMNIALPYQDLTIMDACLECGVNYMDTANYEPEDTNDPAWRTVYEKRCREKGFSAYFDYSWSGHTASASRKPDSVLCSAAASTPASHRHTARTLRSISSTLSTLSTSLDCNGGDHGYPFATNFNPEINLREVSAPGSYIETASGSRFRR